jgi:hypothetical protein
MSVYSIPSMAGTILLAGLLFSHPQPAWCYDLGPVQLHGFASQGFILTSENNIHGSGTKTHGSFDFNELGLNGSYQLQESIVCSGQVVSRDLGDEGNNAVYIDYLQADMQFTDWFGTRIGRYKVPMGFYNQTRDIDLARPTVFLPQSIYPEEYRPFVSNATGGLIYGNMHHAGLGNFDYEFFYGQAGEDDDSCLVQALEVMYNGRDMDMESKASYGGSVQYTPPIDGLRFGVSFLAGDSDFDYIDNTTGLKATSERSMNSTSIVSVAYALADFTFVSEYMYSRQRNTLKIGDTTIYKNTLREPEGFYIGGAYRITNKLETALYWESFSRDKNDRHGDDLQAAGLEDHQAWHKGWTLAVRYDITDWWLMKAEASLIDGTGLTSPHYKEPGTLARHSNSLYLKTTFHF